MVMQPVQTAQDPETQNPVPSKSSKHFRLILWRLLYHVAVEKRLDRDDEVAACLHARFPVDLWYPEKARCHREWDRLLAKRQRRLAWFRAHGAVPSGWTPPDPADPRRTAIKPVAAYLARRKTTEAELFDQIRRRVRRQPDWKSIQRVTAWNEGK